MKSYIVYLFCLVLISLPLRFSTCKIKIKLIFSFVYMVIGILLLQIAPRFADPGFSDVIIRIEGFFAFILGIISFLITAIRSKVS